MGQPAVDAHQCTRRQFGLIFDLVADIGPALMFGDPRVMALAGALAVSSNLIGGFSNKTFRSLIGGLLGEPDNQAECC